MWEEKQVKVKGFGVGERRGEKEDIVLTASDRNILVKLEMSVKEKSNTCTRNCKTVNVKVTMVTGCAT